MHLLLSLLTLAGSLTGEVGTITYYADGVMDTVYQNRLAWRHVEPCSECIGMVAIVGGRENLNRRVWIQRPGQALEGPFLVVDVSNADHLPAQRRRGLVAEVDYATARRWRMAGPLPDVRILFAP